VRRLTQIPRRVALPRRAYKPFNQRDVEAALAPIDTGVEWPSVLEATTLHGRDAVRAYWQAQFESSIPLSTRRRSSRCAKMRSSARFTMWCATVPAVCWETCVLPTHTCSAVTWSSG
jgi:SnoaL-like domain